MVDRVLFRRFVREALAHLYEPAYLLGHSLSALLVEAGLIQGPDQLARFLADAVEQIRPPETAPHSSPGWRQYRYLHLRYIQGSGHNQVATDLLLSIRQASREHEAGLDALAGLLWNRYVSAQPRARPGGPGSREADTLPPGVPTESALEAELGRLTLGEERAPTNLEEVLSGALATIARAALARGVSCHAALPPSLPPVLANRVALRHLLLNVLDYLIEAAGPGQLLARAAIQQGMVELVLERMTEAPVGSLPNPGTFAPATTEDSALALVRRLARGQGVIVRVETTDRSLPRVVLALAATRARTVLLVDDSPDIGRLFRRYLAGTSYCLVHVRSAEQGRVVARKQHPEIVVLDVLLPRADGWQLLEQFQADETLAGVPVLVCSVMPESSLARSLGVAAFLPKPVGPEDLLAALARWCPEEESTAHPDSTAGSALPPQSSGRSSV